MANRHFVALETSHRGLPQGAARVAEVPADEQIELSLYLKPTGHAAEAEAVRQTSAKRETLRDYRATAYRDSIARIQAFADEYGLAVTAVEPGRRLVKVKGSAAQLQKAFATEVAVYEHQGKRFRGRSGVLSAPQEIAGELEAVLGFDTRPVAVPHFVTGRILAPADVTAHLPNAIGQLYNFPQGQTGAGQTIAIIELGGGYTPSDTSTAFANMGLAVPNVVAVSVDGASNSPGTDADGEVALDIQVAGGNAPGATLAVYFAPNTSQGFVDAVSQAAHDGTNAPHVMSISWGGPEAGWSAQDVQSLNSALQDAATLNVSVFVAAGDNLGTDGLDNGKANVDFPASSPWAIGCGGTTIDTSGATIGGETVWNSGSSGEGTGGGISDLFAVPSFQQGVTLPASVNDGGTRRGVPDVAANADPASGYLVVLNGQSQPIGGTSAVAPLWAGLTALINQGAAGPIGFFLPKLYGNAGAMKDITTGNNIPQGTSLGYSAAPGWDACTGLGSPNGAALLAVFTAGPTS